MRDRPWRDLGNFLAVSVACRGDVQDTGSGWTIRLCGPVTVEAAERQGDARPPGRQGRLLLAYLAINRDRPCSRGELIDLLWPEAPPAAADTALSALLSKLRRVLGSGALVGRSNVRLVAPGAVTVDVEEAARAARRAEAALQDGAWRPAETAARQALTADPAAFLPDCDGSWVRDQRASLEVLRVRALEVLAEACLRAGELGEAEDAARAAVAAAPFRESSHRLLMEVHEAAGNPAEALRVFEDLRRLLREELGTAPGPAAMAVHERMLRGGAPAVRRPARRARHRAGRAGRAPLAGAAGGAAQSPRLRRPRRRGRLPRELLAPRGRRHPRPGRARRGRRDRQDAARGRARAPRPRRRRARALRALRRGRAGALQARGGAAARVGRRRVARARGRAARRARRRPRDRPPGAGPGAGRARGRRRAAADRGGRRAPPAALRRAGRAAGRDRRRGAAARGARRHPLGRPPHAPARSATSCGRPRRSGCCSWPRCATRRPTSRSPACSPRCAARGRCSSSRSAGSTCARPARSSPRSAAGPRTTASSPRCTTRPRGTRSSSRRWSGTSPTARDGWAAPSRCTRRACPRACARSPLAGWRGCRPRRARRWPPRP